MTELPDDLFGLEPLLRNALPPRGNGSTANLPLDQFPGERSVVHVAAVPVKAVDTTGAGDAFVGSLAFFLAAGKSVPDVMRRANHIAAVSVQSERTQSRFPAAGDLPRELLA